VVDDLHHFPGVHSGEIAQELEAELGVIVECSDHGHDITGTDPNLSFIVALAHGTEESIAEARFEAGPEVAVHA